MIRFATAFAILVFGFLSTAEAKSHYHHYSHHYSNRHYTSSRHHHYAYNSSLSAACQEAAREGGPCGCWTEEHLLGTSAHILNGWNPWLAKEWKRVFPHVQAAAGTAAVFGNYHVAPVIGVSADRSKVTIEDNFGTYQISTSGLVFVDPSRTAFDVAVSSRSRFHKAVQSSYQYTAYNQYHSEIQ
jgi:hypothetical protein